MATREEAVRAVIKYLRDEADFNRSWADGRRGADRVSCAYKARRLELAQEREQWAAALLSLDERVRVLEALWTRADEYERADERYAMSLADVDRIEKEHLHHGLMAAIDDARKTLATGEGKEG